MHPPQETWQPLRILREQLEALRTAQAAGMTDPSLINKAMLTELDALRATRLTEIAAKHELLGLALLSPLLVKAISY